MIRSIRYFHLGLLLLMAIGCNKSLELVTNLSEIEANEILVVLHEVKISGSKSTVVVQNKPAFSIAVSSSDFEPALKLLVENRFPREMSAGYDKVYPPGSGGLIPTKAEERAKFLMALQGEVENLIQILPGIVRVRVAVVLPDPDTLRKLNAAEPKSSASVAVVYVPLKDGSPPIQAEGIKSLVASAIEELGPNEVTVVMTPNIPVRLIDSEAEHSARTKVVSRDLPNTPASFDGGHQTVVTKRASAKEKAGVMEPEVEKARAKSELLIWLFAVLAIIGLGLGVLGLIRAMSLKSKLNAVTQGRQDLAAAPASQPPPAEPNTGDKNETDTQPADDGDKA